MSVAGATDVGEVSNGLAHFHYGRGYQQGTVASPQQSRRIQIDPLVGPCMSPPIMACVSSGGGDGRMTAAEVSILVWLIPSLIAVPILLGLLTLSSNVNDGGAR